MNANATREDVIELAESADVPGLYERAKSAAIQRGHGEQTAFAGIGGLLGGVLGSFRGPFGAAVGALLGALLGAFVGRERDRARRTGDRVGRPAQPGDLRSTTKTHTAWPNR